MKQAQLIKLTSIVLAVVSVSSCQLGEIDIAIPAYGCTADGYQVDAQGVIITDPNGLALSCTPQ